MRANTEEFGTYTIVFGVNTVLLWGNTLVSWANTVVFGGEKQWHFWKIQCHFR